MNIVFDLNDYRSPGTDRSYYKGVPIQYKELVRKILKNHGIKDYRFYFRGPRTHGSQSHCVLQDAKTFAIYRRFDR